MRRRALSAMALATALALGACSSDGDDDSAADSTDRTAPVTSARPREIVNDTPWRAHVIDDRGRGANALGPGDVNGDGRRDYVTNYEFDQKYTIAFHPPEGTDPTLPWETVDLISSTAVPGKGSDTENAALGDLDGDGNLDVVGVQGAHETAWWEGDEPGVRIYWGPDAADVTDASAWVDAGIVPATVDMGHYHWVITDDVNDDGATDILFGGRLLEKNNRVSGVVWLAAPADPAARRDLERWELHAIDPDQTGGHGFVQSDVDDDGDRDLVLANADFDTPEGEEVVLWYEHPGPDDAALTEPWPRHEIYRSPGFYPKPQIAIGDLDGDGLDDVVTQTPDDLVVLRKTGTDPVAFEPLVVPKDPVAQWPARYTRLGDLDDDGRLDVVGGLTHDNGVVPIGKASMFWMEYGGAAPAADNWTTHVVQWGPGRTMNIFTFGLKWDQGDVTDVDDDGDLDIVANNEEWWQSEDPELTPWHDLTGRPESVGVVWFENRLFDDPPRCTEREGRCVLEAEHASELLDGTWIERTANAGAVDGAYLQAFNALDPAKGCPALDPGPDCPVHPEGILQPEDSNGVRFDLTLDGGSYTVWLRQYAPIAFGDGLGGERSDSAWVLLDDRGGQVEGGSPGEWIWVPVLREVALDAGDHTLTLNVRDRGLAIDRVVVQRADAPALSGDGPAETLAATAP